MAIHSHDRTVEPIPRVGRFGSVEGTVSASINRTIHRGALRTIQIGFAWFTFLVDWVKNLIPNTARSTSGHCLIIRFVRWFVCLWSWWTFRFRRSFSGLFVWWFYLLWFRKLHIIIHFIKFIIIVKYDCFTLPATSRSHFLRTFRVFRCRGDNLRGSLPFTLLLLGWFHFRNLRSGDTRRSPTPRSSLSC